MNLMLLRKNKEQKLPSRMSLTLAAELLSADEHSVTWIDVSRTAVLHHAPLSVAGFLGEALFGNTPSC
jgi:hypothetical protein